MPKAQAMKDKIDSLDFIKIENIGIAKDTIKKVKTNYRMGENTCKICLAG